MWNRSGFLLRFCNKPGSCFRMRRGPALLLVEMSRSVTKAVPLPFVLLLYRGLRRSWQLGLSLALQDGLVLQLGGWFVRSQMWFLS